MTQRLKRSKVIIVSHSMFHIRAYCDVVVLVDRGRTTVFNDIEAGIAAYQAKAPANAEANVDTEPQEAA
jgi:capsular polysaccharide transport system ATP-binding protein